jgi:DNA-binding response OmpR family regulator
MTDYHQGQLDTGHSAAAGDSVDVARGMETEGVDRGRRVSEAPPKDRSEKYAAHPDRAPREADGGVAQHQVCGAHFHQRQRTLDEWRSDYAEETMRILVVEDDRRLAASLRRGLEDVGFAVDTAYDGEEAIACTEVTSFDLIVLDVMLPGLDGLEVSRRLRGRRVHVPILMLTARDSVDDRVQGLEAGADDYLVKPFALRELVARMKALLRRHLPDRTSILRSGPIELDLGRYELRVHGRTVALTAKEFAILEYFMLNPGQLLTRDQIIEHVWNYDFDGGHNLIEVYVGRLRRKLTGAGASDPLVTIRGFGYRFDPLDES